MRQYTLRVTGLAIGTGEGTVSEFFSRFGEVVACSVNGTEATVSFNNEEEFKEALLADDYEVVAGVAVKVEAVEEDSGDAQTVDGADVGSADAVEKGGSNGANGDALSDPGRAEESNRQKRFREDFKVAVRHLPDDTTEEQLRAFFEGAGSIVDFFLEPRRRYAFVGFDSTEAVEAALRMSGQEFNNTVINVERKRTAGRENQLEMKVVIKNVPPSVTENSLREFFSEVGDPVDIFIHEKKLFAFVGFADEAACAAAIRLDGTEMDGQRVQIERRQRQRCYKCNKEGHVATQCRGDRTCRSCGRPGHLARECRMPPGPYERNRGGPMGAGPSGRMGHAAPVPYYGAPMGGGVGGDRRGDMGRRGAGMDRRAGGEYDRRRPRSRSPSYERRHRRRSRSRTRSRSPKRFVRERERERGRDRSRSPSRRRYQREAERGRTRDERLRD